MVYKTVVKRGHLDKSLGLYNPNVLELLTRMLSDGWLVFSLAVCKYHSFLSRF